MALTRKMLKAMGIEDEKIEQIIEAHTEVTDGLKAERDALKDSADKLKAVEKERDDLRKEVEANNNDSYKEKYEKEHKDFEDYKSSIAAKETEAKKKAAYKALLKEAGVSDKRLDAIVKITSLDDIELDAEGKVKDADNAKETIKAEYSDWIVTEGREGENPETPPKGNGGGNGQLSRAAMVAQRHNEMLYGVKGDNK